MELTKKYHFTDILIAEQLKIKKVFFIKSLYIYFSLKYKKETSKYFFITYLNFTSLQIFSFNK